MQERNNYGKIIAITLSVIAAASAIAFVLYRLARNLLAFYADYDKDEEPEVVAEVEAVVVDASAEEATPEDFADEAKSE